MSKVYLFDDEDNQSVLHNCSDWDNAEKVAEQKNLTLVGQFVMWVDADTLERTYVN